MVKVVLCFVCIFFNLTICIRIQTKLKWPDHAESFVFFSNQNYIHSNEIPSSKYSSITNNKLHLTWFIHVWFLVYSFIEWKVISDTHIYLPWIIILMLENAIYSLFRAISMLSIDIDLYSYPLVKWNTFYEKK